MTDHMKKYDAQKRINQYRIRENHGLDYISAPLRQQVEVTNHQNSVANKQKEDRFNEIMMRKEAQIKYA